MSDFSDFSDTDRVKVTHKSVSNDALNLSDDIGAPTGPAPRPRNPATSSSVNKGQPRVKGTEGRRGLGKAPSRHKPRLAVVDVVESRKSKSGAKSRLAEVATPRTHKSQKPHTHPHEYADVESLEQSVLQLRQTAAEGAHAHRQFTSMVSQLNITIDDRMAKLRSLCDKQGVPFPFPAETTGGADAGAVTSNVESLPMGPAALRLGRRTSPPTDLFEWKDYHMNLKLENQDLQTQVERLRRVWASEKKPAAAAAVESTNQTSELLAERKRAITQDVRQLQDELIAQRNAHVANSNARDAAIAEERIKEDRMRRQLTSLRSQSHAMEATRVRYAHMVSAMMAKVDVLRNRAESPANPQQKATDTDT